MKVLHATTNGVDEIALKQVLTIRRDHDGTVSIGQSAIPADATGATSETAVAHLMPLGDHRTGHAALVSTPGAPLRVNGYPPLPVAILEDRDRICVGSERLVFAAYGAAEDEVFVAGAGETRCACCRVPLATGVHIVRCPACSAPYHTGEVDEKTYTGKEPPPNCADYEAVCYGCQHDRRALSWSAEEIAALDLELPRLEDLTRDRA